MSKNKRSRDILENFAYEDLKQKLFLEDCKHCGTNKNLTIHHKKKISKYPHLQYVKSNCEILCIRCHRKVHQGRKHEKSK